MNTKTLVLPFSKVTVGVLSVLLTAVSWCNKPPTNLNRDLCEQIVIDHKPCPETKILSDTSLTPDVSMDIQIHPVETYAKIPSSPGINLDGHAFAGHIDYKDGQLLMNGRPLDSQRNDAVQRACRDILCQPNP